MTCFRRDSVISPVAACDREPELAAAVGGGAVPACREINWLS